MVFNTTVVFHCDRISMAQQFYLARRPFFTKNITHKINVLDFFTITCYKKKLCQHRYDVSIDKIISAVF